MAISERHYWQAPERKGVDKVSIPNLLFLTGTAPPLILDYQNPGSLIYWLEQLVLEEKALNSRYKGLYLFGSIAEGRAVGGSDIDLLHIVMSSPQVPHYRVAQAIQHRLKSIVTVCYGAKLDSDHYWDRVFPRSTGYGVERLNKFSIPIGVSETTDALFQTYSGHMSREVFAGLRWSKQPSQDCPMPMYHYPADGLFPWWAAYGLLQPMVE